MSQVALKLNRELVKSAKTVAAAEHRSIPKQIEYWAKIGQIAVENPDLNYEMIRDILLGLAQVQSNDIEDYVFANTED